MLIGTTFLAFATIIVSLIWARFQFFRIKSESSKVSALLYDPVVVIQILWPFYLLYTGYHLSSVLLVIALFCYLLSACLFWWAIFTANGLEFAFSSSVGKIITTGPYKFVRHPFYLSYIITWSTNTLLFNSIPLWITLLYLITFYSISARREEKVIMESEHATEYSHYQKNVGMFLPRVHKWKSWLSKQSTPPMA